GVPTNVSAESRNNGAKITFKAPTTGNTNVQHYVIEAYRGSDPFAQMTTAGSGTQPTFTALTNGKNFKFRVRAVNVQAGPGASSAFSKPIVVGAPGRPTKVSATAGHQSATVKWAKPAATNGAAITGYKVVAHANGVAKKTVVFHKPATTQKVTGLPTG